MATGKHEQWYSDGLTAEKAGRLIKDYAMIRNPVFGIHRRKLSLKFSLDYAEHGMTDLSMSNTDDIAKLLIETKAMEVPKLNGQVVETFLDGADKLVGISVNSSLVL